MTAKVKLSHVGIPAQHPKDLAAFYHDFLGLQPILEGTLPQLGQFVFLSEGEAENSQALALMTRSESKHIAWRVESLAALKSLASDARARGLHAFALNHRVTLSLYVRDPEGNAFEVFWPTGQESEGLYAEPLDMALFEQPDSALLERINQPLPA